MTTENTTSRFSAKSAFALGAGSALIVAALAVYAVRHDGRAEAAVAPAPAQIEASTTAALPPPIEADPTTTSAEPKPIPGHVMPPVTPAASSASVLSGTISLDDSAAKSVSGKVIVFVIARSGAGPTGKGHPVFAKRLDVTSFPVSFSLSAQDSMMGQAPPDHVTLEARIDLDGDAMTHEANAPSAKNESVAVPSHDVALVLKHGV
jgi:hypothetical protein